MRPGSNDSRTVALMRSSGDWLHEPLNYGSHGESGHRSRARALAPGWADDTGTAQAV